MTSGNSLLTRAPENLTGVVQSQAAPTGAAFSVSALPHDVATYGTDPDYNWRLDAYHSYLLAMRLKALAIGSMRPSSVWEFYYCEAHGVIP